MVAAEKMRSQSWTRRRSLRWESFEEKVGFKPKVKERGSQLAAH